jgi:hypothetical protein
MLDPDPVENVRFHNPDFRPGRKGDNNIQYVSDNLVITIKLQNKNVHVH